MDRHTIDRAPSPPASSSSTTTSARRAAGLRLEAQGYEAVGVHSATGALASGASARWPARPPPRRHGRARVQTRRRARARSARHRRHGARHHRTAVEALRKGAYGCHEALREPRPPQKVAHATESTRLRRGWPASAASWATAKARRGSSGRASPCKVRDLVERLGPTDAVLLLGSRARARARGARAARALARHERPFAAVNCAALPPELLEHALRPRARVPGANQDREGLFGAADQARCSSTRSAGVARRAGQAPALPRERRFTRLGATHEETTDVRVITATTGSQDGGDRAPLPRGPVLPPEGRAGAPAAAARRRETSSWRSSSRSAARHGLATPRLSADAVAARPSVPGNVTSSRTQWRRWCCSSPEPP